MHCPCAISLFFLGAFLLFQPSLQDEPQPLFWPKVPDLSTDLTIICSGKQLFGPVPHDPSLEPSEVSIMQLNEHVYSNVRPIFKVTAVPGAPGGTEKSSGPTSGKEFGVINNSKKVDEFILMLTVRMECEYYGLYQCSMKLPNSSLSPNYKVFHQNFYVDVINNIPKLMLLSKITSFVKGQEINITCEHSTREKRMGMAIFYRPLHYYKYFPLKAVKSNSYSEFIPGTCGGYFDRYFSVILKMDELLWESAIVCVANRSTVNVADFNQDLTHDLISNPVILGSRGGSRAGCVSTIAIARQNSKHAVDKGKASTVSYSPLLDFALVSLAVSSIVAKKV